MHTTLRRLHIWAGLFSFTSLLVMAAAGFHVTLRPAPSQRVEPAPEVRELPYRAATELTDRAVADELYRQLALPFTAPLPAYAVRRDEQQRLVLRFETQNGDFRVTVLEDEGKVRIEHHRSSFAEFLDLMHSRTFLGSQPQLPIRLWALYVDASLFALLFLLASGLWLAWRARRGLLWARALLVSGALVVGTLWWVIR
jgi:uncharacterized iron-regulated membrane protein